MGLLPVLASADVLSLSNLSWTLKNQNGSIVIPGKVPSQAHLDLLNAGIITEPLLGINGEPLFALHKGVGTHIWSDFTERWVVTTDWTYTASLAPFLNSSAGRSKNARHLLVFYGLDTVANIVSGLFFAFESPLNVLFRQSETEMSPGSIASFGNLFSTLQINCLGSIPLETPI